MESFHPAPPDLSTTQTKAATANEAGFDFQLDEFYLDLQEEGRRISILPPEEIVRMPFPGLRPFKTSEFLLFKGRDGQSEELLKRLENNRFLAVIGSSGTGKSSLVRAGLIPQLFGGYLHGAGNRWNIAICRPGKNPIANLAIALSSVKGESWDREHLFSNYKIIADKLNSSLYGLLDVNAFLHEEKAKEDQANLLVIVDQFEEIFRYDRRNLGWENIENYFVDLLLKAAANRKNPIYVIITMRSEFLGDCVKFRDLPKAINEGQYLVPGLNRTQLKEVIEGPIHLAGKEISPDLVEYLINEIEENKVKENLDQLPILQHALMRTYQEAARNNAKEITYEHYEKIGKMEKALANHAKEKFDELADGNTGKGLSKKQQIAKITFQALTDASTDLKGGRRPVELKYIQAIAAAIGATKEEVNEVVNKFRDENTSFIMPPSNTVLHEDLILDISHESLMRNWDMLRTWVGEEVDNGELYRKLNERREENDIWMPEPKLQEMLQWRERYPHNAVWASRYHRLPVTGNDLGVHEAIYRQNIDFLDKCKQVVDEEKEEEKRRAEEKVRMQEEQARMQRELEMQQERMRMQEERTRMQEEKMQRELAMKEQLVRRDEVIQKQKEKARKRMIWVLSTGIGVAVLLAVWAFSSRALAVKKEKDADYQKNNALSLAEELKFKKKQAEDSREVAKNERDRANELASKVAQQFVELQKVSKAIEKERDNALALQRIIEEKNKELGKKGFALSQQIVEHNLHEEAFYKSKFLDERTKEQLVLALFKEPITRQEEVPYRDFINEDLLKDLNKAIGIREQFAVNPVASLRNARKMWDEKKDMNSLVKDILFQIFERKVFSKQRIDPSFYQSYIQKDVPSLLRVKDESRFAFAASDQLVTGHYGGDSMIIDDIVWPAILPNSFLTGDSLWDEQPEYAVSKTVALKLVGNNAVLSLHKDGSVVRSQNGERKRLCTLPGTNPWAAEFSPSGKRLATISQGNVLELWKVDSLRKDRQAASDTISTDIRLKNVLQFIFSPDERQLITLYYDYRFDIWDLQQKKLSAKFKGSRTARAINFADNDHLVVVPSYTNIRLVDTAGQVNYSRQLFRSTVDEDGQYVDRIREVALSPDWKSVLVNAEGNLHLFETFTGESVFKAGSGSTLR